MPIGINQGDFMAIQKSRHVDGQRWDHQAKRLPANNKENKVTLAAVECMQPIEKRPKSLENRAEPSRGNKKTTKLFQQRAYRMPKP